jgi:hypothetical protein
MPAAAYRSANPYRRQFMTYRGVLVEIGQGPRRVVATGLIRTVEDSGLHRTITPTGLERTIYAS